MEGVAIEGDDDEFGVDAVLRLLTAGMCTASDESDFLPDRRFDPDDDGRDEDEDDESSGRDEPRGPSSS